MPLKITIISETAVVTAVPELLPDRADAGVRAVSLDDLEFGRLSENHDRYLLAFEYGAQVIHGVEDAIAQRPSAIAVDFVIDRKDDLEQARFLSLVEAR